MHNLQDEQRDQRAMYIYHEVGHTKAKTTEKRAMSLGERRGDVGNAVVAAMANGELRGDMLP